MVASDGEPQGSAWDRWFCGPQCVEVSRCCGEVTEPSWRNDLTDDELVSVAAHGDELEQLDSGCPPVMSPPAAAYATLKTESTIPWADLSGPRKPSAPSNVGREGPAAPQLLRMRVTDAGKKANPRSVSPSINPCSKFGFITVTVPAGSYLADPSDVMDVEFARHLLALEREAAAALELRRLAHGRYEVQGRRVNVRWGPDNGGCELLACEGELPGGAPNSDGEGELPLGEYLRQMGELAVNIRRPAEKRLLTFVDDGSAGDRYESMRIACEQARLREQAAAGACRRDRDRDPNPEQPHTPGPGSLELRHRLMSNAVSSRAPLGPRIAF